jgi:dipeptidyl aminopeptidase/acylaminoacyl peptidase
VSVSLPPRPPDLGDGWPIDQDALIEEARRRARRRRQRNLAGVLTAILGALWLYSLLGGGGPQSGSAFLSESSPGNSIPPRSALPEELSYNANGGIVLIRRDGTRHVLARATYRHLPNGRLNARLYNAIEWSRDGSKLLALRWGAPRALVVIDAKGRIGPTIVQALDGRWSPDGARIAFVRREPGLGRVLYLAGSDGRSPIRIATRAWGFSWSPDGTKLAYTRAGTSGIVVADLTGRSMQRRVKIAENAGTPPVYGSEVQWSPDGSRIAFTTRTSTAEFAMFVVRVNGTSLRRVMAGGYGVVWSPDGRLLALAGPAGPATFGDVSVVHADGSGLRRIARCRCDFRGISGQSLAWSPDGSRIAYISGRGNAVSTIRPDGSGAVAVAPRATPGPSGLQVNFPLWRPAASG